MDQINIYLYTVSVAFSNSMYVFVRQNLYQGREKMLSPIESMNCWIEWRKCSSSGTGFSKLARNPIFLSSVTTELAWENGKTFDVKTTITNLIKCHMTYEWTHCTHYQPSAENRLKASLTLGLLLPWIPIQVTRSSAHWAWDST